MFILRSWYWRMGWYNWRDNLAHWLARRLPKRLRYWVAIDMAAIATSGDYGMDSPTDLTVIELLKRNDIE